MKRPIAVCALALGALALTGTAVAHDGHGKHSGEHHGKRDDHGDHGKGNGNAKFTFTLTNEDNGSCGANAWATLQEKRTYVVHQNKDGSFTLIRFDRGTFTTNGGASPGAC